MHSRAQAWYGRWTWDWRDYPADVLLAGKRRVGARISVVIPARDEEQTVANVVGSLRAALVERIPLVDEVVVIDSDSADGTATAAARAGATVHRARDVATEFGTYPGKGEALWKSLLVTDGDLLIFVDADLTQWGPPFVTGLLGPLLADPACCWSRGSTPGSRRGRTAPPLLLDEGGYLGPRLLRSVHHDEPAAACLRLGAGLRRLSDRVGLLVMTDGSGCRSLRASGYLNPATAAFDATIEQRVRKGDLGPLRAMGQGLARELLAAGRPGFQVLAGALPGRDLATEILYAGDPFGVFYLVGWLAGA